MTGRCVSPTTHLGGRVTEPHFTWGAILLGVAFPVVVLLLAAVLHVRSGRRRGRS